MAKNEHKTESSEKRKAKKRKQPIVEEIHEEKVYVEQSKNALKRKAELPTKSSTTKKQKSHQDETHATQSDEEVREPTATELCESEKPENLPCIETVRQKKQKSHEKNLKDKQDHAHAKESDRNADYLKRWKNSRSEWKFEKLRQVSIQKSVLDASKMNDEIFEIALEYLAGTKGAARSAMEKSAEEEIKQLDETTKHDKIKMIRYRRALELTRMLG